MNVAVDIPEEIAEQLKAAWGDLPRGALEAILVEGYRCGALTRGQVASMLNLSLWETQAFLKERQAYLPYGEADLAQDRETLDRVYPRWPDEGTSPRKPFELCCYVLPPESGTH